MNRDRDPNDRGFYDRSEDEHFDEEPWDAWREKWERRRISSMPVLTDDELPF